MHGCCPLTCRENRRLAAVAAASEGAATRAAEEARQEERRAGERRLQDVLLAERQKAVQHQHDRWDL